MLIIEALCVIPFIEKLDTLSLDTTVYFPSLFSLCIVTWNLLEFLAYYRVSR